MIIKQRNLRISQINIFLIMTGIIDIIFIIANMISGGQLLNQEALGANFIFGDYYSNLGFSSYGSDLYHMPEYVCFPPLAYCFYYLCYLMAPSPSSSNLSEINWLDFTTGANTPLIFLMVNLITVVLFVWVCSCYFCTLAKDSGEFKAGGAKYTLLLPVIVLFSYPCMLTSIQRGNSAFLVAVLLCLAWIWLDSERPAQREGALILIAIATAFKIYPAIMGLYLIKKKDFKAALRLVVYCAILFFLPFIWFGGLDGLNAFIGTLLHMSEWNLENHFGTVRGMAYYLLRQHSSLTAAGAETVGYVLEQIFLIVSVILFFLSKKKWQSVLMISAILASYIGGNAHYTLVYYLPALLMYLWEQRLNSTTAAGEYMYFTLVTWAFAFIFSCPFFMPHGCYFGVSLASYVLWILGAGGVIYNTNQSVLSAKQ